jgi:hypothetical protein
MAYVTACGKASEACTLPPAPCTKAGLGVWLSVEGNGHLIIPAWLLRKHDAKLLQLFQRAIAFQAPFEVTLKTTAVFKTPPAATAMSRKPAFVHVEDMMREVLGPYDPSAPRPTALGVLILTTWDTVPLAHVGGDDAVSGAYMFRASIELARERVRPLVIVGDPQQIRDFLECRTA